MLMDKESKPTFPIIGWLDEPAKKSFNSVFDGINRGVESLDIFRTYRSNHYQRLNADLRSIKILGMTSPIDLLHLYSPAVVSTSISGRLYEQDWLSAKDLNTTTSRRRKKDRQSVDADEFIEKNTHVVVLGSAGSGKTTLLRYLALAYCDKKLFSASNLKTSKIPFYTSLLEYSRHAVDGVSIRDYFAMQLTSTTNQYASDFVNRIFTRGDGIIFLDSLDEVPLGMREKTLHAIQEFAVAYSKNKVVVSSRSADYHPVHESFAECELTRLNTSAINKIVNAWFAQDEDKAAQLRHHLENDEGVYSLCETPLLLSLLCIQFRHDLMLPKRRIELYRRCIDAFLRDWDASRGFRRDTAYAQLSDDRKERIFETVAGKFFKEDQQYVFPQERLIDVIKDCCDLFDIPDNSAKEVLNEIEAHHGILERFSIDSFMFSHLSFQEFFAAKHIITQREELSIVRSSYRDEKWSSVIEFIVAMHPDPGPIYEVLMRYSDISGIRNFPTLASRMKTLRMLYRSMLSGAPITKQLRASLYDHLIDAHFHMSATFGAAGVYPLAVLGANGVKHTYVFYKKRPSLPQALEPLGVLANEILRSAPEEYCTRVIERVSNLDFSAKGRRGLETISSGLCVIVPILFTMPNAIKFVPGLNDSNPTDYNLRTLKRYAEDSLRQLKALGKI